MRHRDGELFFISECLQLLLPQAISDSVRTTPIRCNQEPSLPWIECFAPLLPPASDAFHRKLRRVMINAHIDEPVIVNQIVDPIGDGFAIGQREKVISNSWHAVWMCSNCASRSGCDFPSMFFLLARRE